MANFGGLILTNKGRALQAKVQAGEALVFNRIAAGDGSLGSTSISTLNALISEKKSLAITKLKTQAGGKAIVGCVLSNLDIVTGFYFKEIGVFAEDPDDGEILYCYANAGAGAEYIAAGGGPDVIEKNIDVIVLTANAASVTATIDSGIYALSSDVGDMSTVTTDSKVVAGAIIELKSDIAGIDTTPADDSITDAKIGNRTIDDTVTGASGADTPTNLWSKLGNMIKQITGKTHWYTAPVKSIEQLNTDAATHLADTTPHATIQGVTKLGLTAGAGLTVASGAITVTNSYHTVDTEGAAATDDLDTISGGTTGDRLILVQANASHDITIKSSTGNIYTFDRADIVMDSNTSAIELFHTGSFWVVLGIQGVKRSGDTMTGPLTVNGATTANAGAGTNSLYAAINRIGENTVYKRMDILPDAPGGYTGGLIMRPTDVPGSGTATFLLSLLGRYATGTTTLSIKIDGDTILDDGTATSPEIKLNSTTRNGGIDNAGGIIRFIDRVAGVVRLSINLSTGLLSMNDGATTHGQVTGSPEGVVTAPVGSTRYRTDGGATTTLYVKTSGTGNTGWTAK